MSTEIYGLLTEKTNSICFNLKGYKKLQNLRESSVGYFGLKNQSLKMKFTLSILLPLFLYCFECQAAWQATGYPGNQNWNKALLVQPQNWQQHQPQNLGLQQQQQRGQKPNNLPPRVTMILDLPTLLKAAKALGKQQQKQELEQPQTKPREEEELDNFDEELEVGLHSLHKALDHIFSFFKAAKNAFIEALDEYVSKCQQLRSRMRNNNDEESTANEAPADVKMEQMMDRFVHLLQGFAFQITTENNAADY